MHVAAFMQYLWLLGKQYTAILPYSSGYWAPVVLLCVEQEILPEG